MSSAFRPSRLRALALHGTVAILVLLAFAGLKVAFTAKAPDYQQACRDGQPFYVVSSFRAQTARNRPPDLRSSSILLFSDTPKDDPYYELASFRDTGAVWGLAYRQSEQAIYAGTYHKRSMPYGSEGPGAVYRVDLATGEVTHFLTVPNAGDRQRGSSMSNGRRLFDQTRSRDVGEAALGDLDISTDESELYVANLYDRRVYRYEMPSGNLLGSFEHGAAGESWARYARPFGLAYHRGSVYHGVLNSRGTGDQAHAQVYRSDPDGSNMELAAAFTLDYRRDSIRLRTMTGQRGKWGPWSDPRDNPNHHGPIAERDMTHTPQPMLTDLAFTDSGTMVIGMRDRHTDIVLQWIAEDETLGPTPVTAHAATPTPMPPRVVMSEMGIGFGDILKADPDAGSWQVQTEPEHFDDTNALGHAESALGGLAIAPGSEKVAASAYGVADARSEVIVGEEGVFWFDVGTGERTSLESLGRAGRAKDYDVLLRATNVVFAHTMTEIFQDYEYLRDLGSLGDVEVLCAPEITPPTPTPTNTLPGPTPTDTVVTPTPTDTPSVTDTPVPPSPTPTPTDTPTLTPTPVPGPVYLPLLLREHCRPKYLRADIVLVLDTSSSMKGEKLADAKAAAQSFLQHADMAPGRDQVAVVRFDRTAQLVTPLTSDRATVRSAIARLEHRYGTHIDLGLQDGLDELGSDRRLEANTPVLILLTDGIQTGTQGAELLAAEAVREAAIRFYAIGLGADVDGSTLATMVGDESRYHFAPDSAELLRIYREIANDILCPPEDLWGKR